VVTEEVVLTAAAEAAEVAVTGMVEAVVMAAAVVTGVVVSASAAQIEVVVMEVVPLSEAVAVVGINRISEARVSGDHLRVKLALGRSCSSNLDHMWFNSRHRLK